MKGRRPKTTEEHIIQGTFQPVRHANRLTLPTTQDVPPPPADFDEAHRAAWIEFCETLKEANLLTKADHYAMRTFVEAAITAKVTYATMLADGFVVEGRKHPAHMVYAEAVKTMRALYDQFGLTPRARMGMKVEKPKEEKESFFEKLLKEANDIDA